MQHLWAPWRMEYILEAKDQVREGCIFCVFPREQEDRDNLILWRGRRAFVMLNKFPYNPGHLLVVPYTHTADLDGLVPDELTDLMLSLRYAIGCLRRAIDSGSACPAASRERTRSARQPASRHP